MEKTCVSSASPPTAAEAKPHKHAAKKEPEIQTTRNDVSKAEPAPLDDVFPEKPLRPRDMKALPQTMLIGDITAHRQRTCAAPTAPCQRFPKIVIVIGSASTIKKTVSGKTAVAM